MDCVCCGSASVTERPECTAHGYRRFRCRDCGKQFNERSGGLLNRTQYPSDVIALVVLWRLRYRLTQRWLGKFGQPDKWLFCLPAAKMPRIRSKNDETSTSHA
jgi:transposase-like protein